jgi:hypothetical protein
MHGLNSFEFAIHKKYLHLVKWFIEEDVFPDFPNYLTTLTVMRGSLEIFKYLLSVMQRRGLLFLAKTFDEYDDQPSEKKNECIVEELAFWISRSHLLPNEEETEETLKTQFQMLEWLITSRTDDPVARYWVSKVDKDQILIKLATRVYKGDSDTILQVGKLLIEAGAKIDGVVIEKLVNDLCRETYPFIRYLALEKQVSIQWLKPSGIVLNKEFNPSEALQDLQEEQKRMLDQDA